MWLVARKRWKQGAVLLFFMPVVLWVILNLIFPFPHDRLSRPASLAVVDQEGQLLRAFLSSDEMWRLYIYSDEITPVLKEAVLAYEDRRFYYHPGVDPIAIFRAAWVNLRAGEVQQGASTITMQVARLMQPRSRTFSSKIIEAFRALQLEWLYSKDEILALYFNSAPYGGNIIGVGAAAHFYFGKSVEQLSLGEAALLTAIPNYPNMNRPDLAESNAEIARAKVLRLLKERELIGESRWREALSEPLPGQRFKLPALAPHLSTYLHQRHGSAQMLRTTISAQLQQRVEKMLANHLRALAGEGITNGAVVIIENETQAVRALVGSSAFFDDAAQGQVNAAMAPRSPGSALKPFVYAAAINEGHITPQRMLVDIPVDYGGYQPENYDRTYNGMITAEEALVRSLNVPAVNLSAQLGPDGLYHFLKKGGISTLTKPSHHYGLSLVLGGGEVTLVDLTNLYSVFANEGRFRPFRILASDPIEEGKQLLKPETAYIITEILSQLRRPDLPAVWEWSRDLPKVAWKTGTSYGHRDAWSIGYTPQYSIGVWIGNMDGKGVPALVGADTAAPLLFDLFTMVASHQNLHWFVMPAGMEQRRVCSMSGGLATPYCPTSRKDWFLPGTSSNEVCSMHQLIHVDSKTGHRLCSQCKLGRTFHDQVATRWPAEVATWLTRNGYPIDEIPKHLPSCTRVPEGDPPIIHSPQPEAEFRLRRGVAPAFQKILLDASVSNTSKTLFWFVDGTLLHKGNPDDRVFYTPTRGSHTLMCMDEEGRSTSVEIVVR